MRDYGVVICPFGEGVSFEVFDCEEAWEGLSDVCGECLGEFLGFVVIRDDG